MRRFGIPPPGWGLSQKLARAIGVMRARVSLTGSFLDAATAAAWGYRQPRRRDRADAHGAGSPPTCRSRPATLAAYRALIDDGYAPLSPAQKARRLETGHTSMLGKP